MSHKDSGKRSCRYHLAMVLNRHWEVRGQTSAARHAGLTGGLSHPTPHAFRENLGNAMKY